VEKLVAVGSLRDAYDVAIGLALWGLLIGSLLAPLLLAFCAGRWTA